MALFRGPAPDGSVPRACGRLHFVCGRLFPKPAAERADAAAASRSFAASQEVMRDAGRERDVPHSGGGMDGACEQRRVADSASHPRGSKGRDGPEAALIQPIP